MSIGRYTALSRKVDVTPFPVNLFVHADDKAQNQGHDSVQMNHRSCSKVIQKSIALLLLCKVVFVEDGLCDTLFHADPRHFEANSTKSKSQSMTCASVQIWNLDCSLSTSTL